MVQTIPAQNLNLHDVKVKFGLKTVEDDPFFREWLDELPELTELETQFLDRVKANFLHLAEYPMLESTVKMVVLSPLLDLADFYRSPFRITAEEPVQISVEDEGEIVQGRIDILVVKEQFWALVIETKNGQFSLKLAIPQALAYMMGNPHPEKPAFGLVTNGSEFMFIKLTKQDTPQYALSNVFSLLNRGNDLYEVLRVLKRLGSLISR